MEESEVSWIDREYDSRLSSIALHLTLMEKPIVSSEFELLSTALIVHCPIFHMESTQG